MRKMKTMDGNQAAGYISYAFTDVAAIFPITPSSPMAEHVDEWASQGVKNLFGQTVKVVELQSEGGAAGAFHGSLQAGALTTTYTASQGFLLMIPNMYKVAGELLPGVFHVSARALASHALSIFGDHQDVMSARATGCALLAESNVQEVMDLSAVAHLAAIEGSLPFINFFDGFRTSHEIQKIEVIEYDELAKIIDMDAVKKFRQRALNPDAPVTRGTAENPDIYFQHREASNLYYDKLPDIVEKYMADISKITGREYHLFNYVGAPDADRVIIAMGSGCDVIETAVNGLNAKGEKVGLLNVHLYRPFSLKHFMAALPKTVKKIAVLDRTKESGAIGEPLFLDVQAALAGTGIKIVGGRYGLSSKDFLVEDVLPVFSELQKETPKHGFTLGIVDDVTFLSLPRVAKLSSDAKGLVACKFWGFGSDGTVGANKSAIKIIGDHTDMYAQAYFSYDSKKSGGVTISHLRFGTTPIKMPYLIDAADYIACHRQAYVKDYDLLRGIKKGGKFLLNCTWSEKELEQNLPAKLKRDIANNDVEFYILNGEAVGQELGLGNRINMVMQAAFFKLANVIPVDEAVKYLKEAIVRDYGKKGDKVVNMNFKAVEAGVNASVKVNVPEAWKTATDVAVATKEVPDYVKNIAQPVNGQIGDDLPVSTFIGREDGTMPAGTAKYEKRGTAMHVPHWIEANCIQCNQCAFVCPHASIRPVLLNDAEVAAAPAGFEVKDALGAKGLHFGIVVSQLDCLGCGNCANVCPAPKKALEMAPIAAEINKANLWEYAMEVSPKNNPMNKYTVKGSQFEQPLFEFSGACAGCGETPYAKLITQLYGDRMMIANATGCSSIWGASSPSAPYTVNAAGHGPAWANSLFEDNAEFGLGMFVGTEKVREGLKAKVEAAVPVVGAEAKAALEDWLAGYSTSEGTRDRSDAVVAALAKESSTPEVVAVLDEKQYLVKCSQWIFGGDGWSYDIGYGGLDHVLASGDNVNVFIFDTEVYSNTGGQASKATHTAAVAQFAASGKKTKKKDLGMMAVSYGYVYVAQVAMGADKNQLIKAIKEAEAYDGPSVIIAYAPCINHGLKIGMGLCQEEEKRAVAAGYWDLYRYNPVLKAESKNPFSLDSKAPTADFREFLLGEVRYSSLLKAFPETAEALFAKTEADAKERRDSYVRLQASFEAK